MNIPSLCVSRPVATAMLTLIAVVVGLFSMFKLPIDLLPELEIPTVSVRAEYGNASPEEMERLVTEYIEESVSVVAGVDELTSTSGEGSTRVSARFVWGTDIDEAANDVRTRIDRVIDELPDDLPRPRVSKYDPNSFPIVILGIASPLDPVELTEMVEDELLYRFERVAGVAQVDLWGESNREIRVELDLDGAGVARHLHDLGRRPVRRIISSPLIRCVQTAAAAAVQLGVHEICIEPSLTEGMLEEMRVQIQTLPAAAEQVLKFANFSPFSALGIERLAAARILNTVNKRMLLKNYRKLALKLHPDKCEHPNANDAMQALNVAYDKITVPPKPKVQAAYGGKKPGPKPRR